MSVSSITKEYFIDIADHVRQNGKIAAFYDHMFLEGAYDPKAAKQDGFGFLNRSKAIDLCCKWWDLDYYRMQAVKDIKRVNLCRDKFCYNCQSLLALKRQNKFGPQLDSLYDDFALGHVVFTVPNIPYAPVGGLRELIKKMYRKFGYLMRYLSGTKKIAGVDFAQYGYQGCLRALEVTCGHDDTFHPHFHCMMVFRKGISFNLCHVNQYSYSYGRLVRKFSDLEILLQKVWFLLMNDIPVSWSSINDCKVGYSVICDLCPKGQYHEVFKYACKGAFKDGTIYHEDVFRELWYALHGRRMIQGYGCLYNVEDDSDEIFETEVEDEYQAMIHELQYLEDPYFWVQSLQDVLYDENCRYVSKQNIRRLVRQRMESD